MLQMIQKDPAAFGNKTITKVTTMATGGIGSDGPDRSTADFRETFLRESVLPNLHRMDPAAQAEVLRAISGDSEKPPSIRRTLFSIIFYAILGFLLLYGFHAVQDLVNTPPK